MEEVISLCILKSDCLAMSLKCSHAEQMPTHNMCGEDVFNNSAGVYCVCVLTITYQPWANLSRNLTDTVSI